MKIKIPELERLLVEILSAKFYATEEAEKIAEVLMYAELAGKDTQGVLKLIGSEPAQGIRSAYPAKITKETKVSALIDGGRAAGPLSAQFAVDVAIRIGKANGFSIVGLHNTYSSVGAIGYYAKKMASEGLVGIVFANCPRSVALADALELVYGTNPMAFGFPTNEFPIVFDMSTAAITWYGLVRAKALGQELPDNVAIDANGNVTTDPEAAMDGAILPEGNSHKGTGLGMVVELLAGALTGASFVFDKGDATDDWGTLFIAINPDLLIGTEQFKKNSSELVRKVKSKKTKSGKIPHIPGYDTELRVKKIIDAGVIEIEDEILKQLRAAVGE
ncbi:MAG: Ldh family oxidoreductase [Candidatus Paceibacterota bacterium]